MKAFWVCPFTDRLMSMFSHNQRYMTLADFLDMMSAFSHRCPTFMKAEVAFRMYDFDEDGLISLEDLVELLKRLTDGALEERDYIDAAKVILEVGDMDGDGYLNVIEFKGMVENYPDFPTNFYHSVRMVRDFRRLAAHIV